MTSDEFRGTYTLLGVVADGDVVTHHAVRARTGEAVLVHEVGASGSSAARQWRERLAALPSSDPLALLATLDVDGRTVLVTRAAVGFGGLADWLAGRQKPGEFTLMFGAGAEGGAPSPPPAPPPRGTPSGPPREWAPNPRATAAPSTPPTVPWTAQRAPEQSPFANLSAPPSGERTPPPDAARPPGRLKIRVKRAPVDATAPDEDTRPEGTRAATQQADSSSLGALGRPTYRPAAEAPADSPPPARPGLSMGAWAALLLAVVAVVGVALALYLR